MVEYPPYVNAYGQMKDLFAKIKEAQTPPRFTQDFMYTMLGLASKSFRPMIPLLKKLGFLNETNVPTKVYSDYRDDSMSETVMAEQIREAYAVLFSASEYAYTLSKDSLISKLSTVLGTSKDDKTTQLVASTFQELCKLADFKDKPADVREAKTQEKKEIVEKVENASTPFSRSLGISYTINLNLPATTDPKVFDAIFKSLKEHLLK